MQSRGIKKQQSWVGKALELPWGRTVPGASLSSTITCSGVLAPFLQSTGVPSHRLSSLSAKGRAGTQEQGLLGHAETPGLLRVFCILLDLGKPSWNQNRSSCDLSDRRKLSQWWQMGDRSCHILWEHRTMRNVTLLASWKSKSQQQFTQTLAFKPFLMHFWALGGNIGCSGFNWENGHH